uniref:Uncharacterized protein n=1 Tax=Cacopsylla melanoneura TaxID=428564 RepID=A0A8D8ZAG7_9HEMI
MKVKPTRNASAVARSISHPRVKVIAGCATPLQVERISRPTSSLLKNLAKKKTRTVMTIKSSTEPLQKFWLKSVVNKTIPEVPEMSSYYTCLPLLLRRFLLHY